jgi:hypothetical protein
VRLLPAKANLASSRSSSTFSVLPPDDRALGRRGIGFSAESGEMRRDHILTAPHPCIATINTWEQCAAVRHPALLRALGSRSRGPIQGDLSDVVVQYYAAVGGRLHHGFPGDFRIIIRRY